MKPYSTPLITKRILFTDKDLLFKLHFNSICKILNERKQSNKFNSVELKLDYLSKDRTEKKNLNSLKASENEINELYGKYRELKSLIQASEQKLKSIKSHIEISYLVKPYFGKTLLTVIPTNNKVLLIRILNIISHSNIYFKIVDHKDLSIFIIYCKSNFYEKILNTVKSIDGYEYKYKDLSYQLLQVENIYNINLAEFNEMEKGIEQRIQELNYTISVYKKIDSIKLNMINRYYSVDILVEEDRFKELRNCVDNAYIVDVDYAHNYTHYRKYRYTEAFQNMANAFAIPKSGDMNPAFFMVFTFPFLFGAMFSDFGHGILLCLLSGLLIWRAKSLEKYESISIVVQARYLLLMSGFHAIIWGLLFGEFFGFDLHLVLPDAGDKHANFNNFVRMNMSLFIGYFHMNLGYLVNIWNSLGNMKYLVYVVLPKIFLFNITVGNFIFNILNSSSDIFVKKIIFLIPTVVSALLLFTSEWYFCEGSLLMNIIEGVEYIIGLISNSSSYLRIWAVGLAHSSLSSIFNDLMLKKGLTLAIFFLPLYFIITLAVLIGLEGLSSSLHSMRLNWIEYFNKFNHGGYEEYNVDE